MCANLAKDNAHNDVKYVYSVSDTRNLIPSAFRSIRSLRKFVAKKDVIVFFSPPRTKLSVSILSKLAVVREVDNISFPFEFFKGSGPRHFGEQIHLCSVDSSTVVFLDDDVIIRKDLSTLLDGEFDFSARRHYPTFKHFKENVDPQKWQSIFKDKDAVAMPNAGFMIFKNNMHKKIKDSWLSLVNNASFLNPCFPPFNPKEQTALSVALSMQNAKTKWLSANEHAYGWLNEGNVDSMVIHKKYLVNRLAREELLLGSFIGKVLVALSKAFLGDRL